MHNKSSAGTIRRRLSDPLTIAMTLAFAASAIGVFFASRAQAAVTLTVCSSGCTHSTIQGAVNAAAAGDTIQVAAGTYNGAVTVDTANLTITGAGATTTQLVNSGSNIVTLNGGADGLILQDLQLANSNRGLATDAAVEDVTLRALDITGNTLRGIEISNNAVADGWLLDGVDVHDNVTASSIGMRFRGTGRDVTITNSHFDDNRYGLYSNTTESPPLVQGELSGLHVTDSTFDGNFEKGMYFESLSNSTFERVSVRGSGKAGAASPAGIDVNVKFGPFSNITFSDSTISGSVGRGIAIKGRNDAGHPQYGVMPASLSGVLLDRLNVTGNTIRGVEIGNNVTNATVQRSRITGNAGGGLLTYADAGSIDAEDNWWGCNAGPGGSGCDTTSTLTAATIDTGPQLVLGLSASPNSVEPGGSSVVTADVTRNSAGQTVSATALNGLPVSFGTDLGGVSPSGGSLANGLSSTTFTAPSSPGTASVSATFDNQTASTPVAVNAPPEPVPNDPGTGTPGPDELIGGAEADVLDGGAGDDTLLGEAGDDILDGGDGADDVFGGVGDDEVLGGAGADLVEGGPGADIVNGGGGADVVGGGTGDDEVHGGKGQDQIEGGPGEDDIHAGAGQDEIDAQDGEHDTVSCGKNVDEVDADGQDDVASNCENVV